jgi:hypothetical protein
VNVAERWLALSPRARWTTGAVAVVVVLNLFFDALAGFTGGDPSGPTSSSYATAADGMAAYAELLEQHGHPVSRMRTPVHEDDDLSPGDTLVVADPDNLDAEEADAIAAFVRRGGRLIAAGPTTGPALRRLLGSSLAWASVPVRSARPVVPVPEVAGVPEVQADERGAWRSTGAGLPVLASDRAVLVAVADVDRGRVVALADASVLHNDLLDQAGNAAFGVAAAGERSRRVRFAEAGHGYGRTGGLEALPSAWQWAAALAALAGLAWMWTKGRRFGPPDELERELPPPRRVYVDAVAASLAKTRSPGTALAPLQRAARDRVARRAGLPAEATPDEVAAAARRFGLDDDEIAALTKSPTGDNEILATGRALAKLEGTTW